MMETSTPKTPQVMPGSSGRGAVGFEMTPLRKNRPSVMFQLDASNDDIERAERRKSVALRKSVLSLPSSSKTPDLNESARPLTEDDIRTHLQICTKLHNENKINTKNAWSLKIIDVLRYMVKKDSPDVLKVAGNSLEIAGKVYGLRVDDLHAEGMKLAGSLARNFDKRGREEDEENGENADPNDASVREQDGAPKKKKAKKRRPLLGNKKHTVNADPKSWKGTVPKIESATFSARTDTTVSAVGNLFTNRVKMDPAGYKFRFLDKDKAWSYAPGNDPSVKKETNRKFPLKLKPLGNCQICAPFKDFHLDKWNPDDESKEFSIRHNSQKLDEVVLDDDGIPIPELDGSIHDIFLDRNDDCNDDDDDNGGAIIEEQAVPHFQHELRHIVDFQPNEQTLASSECRSQYSYNTLIQTSHGQIDRIWAGPSHWKLKFIRSAPPVYTGRDNNKEQEKNKKNAQKKKKNEPRIIMIADLKPPIDPSQFDKKKKQKKKSHVVDNAKITLPLLDSSCKRLIEDKEKLMTIPSMKPVAKTQLNEELDVPAYNYNNPNDSRYIPQDGADEPDLADDIFDNADNDPICTPTEDGADGVHTGLDLIEAPQMVPQTQINYATRAKKMDMKKLKTAVWMTLTNASENDPSAQVTLTSFSKMYRTLPQHLTERMKQELSCPMAFVALLHLCNEQNLELQKGPDLTDFSISGPNGVGNKN